MEYCEFCEVKVDSDTHCDLYTCMVNELNHLKEDFECMLTGKTFNTLNEILDHERISFGAKVLQRETSVNMSVFCPDCGKEFIDRGQKMPVKYLLNRHMRKCSINKERYLRLELQKLVTTLSSEKMVEVIRFIKET